MLHTGVRTCAGIGSYPRRVRLAGVAACDADEPGEDDAEDGASAAKSSFDAGMLSTAASGATSGSVRCQSTEFCTASALVMFGLEIDTLYVTVRTVAEVTEDLDRGRVREEGAQLPPV